MTTKPLSPNLAAIESGIGRRALELGFQQKSRRRYVLEDGDLTFWIGFELDSDQLFFDHAGILSRELDEMLQSAGIEAGRYTVDTPAKGHLWCSAIHHWMNESRADAQAFRARMRKWGPIYWFYPWMKRWERSDPYTTSAYTQQGQWRASEVEGCAEVSLERWRMLVEPWMDRMRDPLRFAQWYYNRRWSIVRDHVCAVAFARAGELDAAKWLLQEEYIAGFWTYEDAIKVFRNQPCSTGYKMSPREMEAAARRSVESAKAQRDRAIRLANNLGVALDPR